MAGLASWDKTAVGRFGSLAGPAVLAGLAILTAAVLAGLAILAADVLAGLAIWDAMDSLAEEADLAGNVYGGGFGIFTRIL